jgi:tetratricopeptide (TPR) repeat protein
MTKTEHSQASNPYLELGACLNQAKTFLNRGNALSALNILETFVTNDFRGIHTAYPEFYEILRVCQMSLGRDTRNADSQIEEMQLDWMTALKKGEQLLKAGKAKESIAYFKRSLNANPGEYGTASGEEAAQRGIKAAKALLKRQEGP